MGVRQLFGANPLDVAVKLIGSTDEKMRVFDAQDRVNLYLEHSKRHVQALIYRMFTRGRREKFEPFATLACAQPLFRRIIDEQSRPVYAPPPVRTVYASEVDEDSGKRKPGPANDKFQSWAKAVRLDARMALATRLMHVGNAVALHPRVTRLGPVLDVIAPNGFWVLPDPDDPLRELAVIYQTIRIDPSTGKSERIFVYWDDFEAFRFNEKGAMVGIYVEDPKDPTKRTLVNRLTSANGHPGTIPFVVIHRYERFGTYWDTTSGNALIAAQDTLTILQMLLLSLHKSQGHTLLGIKGDVPRDQVLDDENPIHLGEDGEAKVLANPTDPSHHLKTMEATMLAAGAANGVGRDMLNAMQAVDLSEATGLLERRADVIRVMGDGEQRQFKLLQVVNGGTEWEIPDEAVLSLDYAEISAKVDRLTQLQIRQQEISQGTRNYLDNVREDNPEICDEEEAEEELEHNLEINSKWVEKFRALNMAVENNVAQPGQSAADNGAMGTAVRDGKMTKETAAAKAQGGAAPGPPAPTPPPTAGR